jgi:hypothetical protein
MESVALHMRRDAISVFETNFCPVAGARFQQNSAVGQARLRTPGDRFREAFGQPQNITEYGKIQNIALDVNNFPLICTVSLTSFMVFL